MKIISLIIGIIFFLSYSLSSQARFVESVEPVESQQAPSTPWQKIKGKVENLWSNYFGEEKKIPSVEKKTELSSVTPEIKENKVSVSPEAKPPEAKPPEVKSAEGKNPSPGVNVPAEKVAAPGLMESQVNNAKKVIKESHPLITLSPGRKGTSELPVTSNGVPTYNFFETKKEKIKGKTVKTVKFKKKIIPKLDIGEEPTISSQSLTQLSVDIAKPQKADVQSLPPPQGYDQKLAKTFIAMKIMKLAPFDEKKVRQGIINGYPITHEMIDKISIKEIPEGELKIREVRHLTPDEQTMLLVLLLNRKGDKCGAVMGLLDGLSKKKNSSDEASYELGICAQKLKLYSQAFTRLLKVIEAEDKSMAPQAIAVLTEDLPTEYEVKMTQVLTGLKNSSLIKESSTDDVHYVMGKGYFKLKQYDKSVEQAQKVGEKNKHYIKARYLLGIGLYAQGKGPEGMKTLLDLRGWMDKKSRADKNVSSLMAINIARIYFNLKNYKSSFEEYKKIGKDHPVWLQGLIEQGWAQISMGDNAGAIGNMHSLHSPYFKSAFKPESYVVRTIGYLNICQYGDAYKSLYRMEQEHMPWIQSIESYLGHKQSPQDYYNTVKNYIQSPNASNVDGLPFQVVREMGRSRDFLNYQASINDKVDEGERLNEVSKSLEKEVNDIRVRMNRAKSRYQATVQKLAKAKTDHSLDRYINEWTGQKQNDADIITGYQFTLGFLSQSKIKLSQFRKVAYTQLDNEKNQLRFKAGSALGHRLAEMKDEVKKYMENNELLRYEIFAGAGENIRYQVAGGETKGVNRVPSNIKPTKILNWEFDGEYWEDEIGNYRSQAQDNCPKHK